MVECGSAVPYFEIIGHVTMDDILLRNKTYRRVLGGPPSYCGLALASLGVRPEAHTKYGPDLPEEHLNTLSRRLILDEDKCGSNRPTTRFVLDYRRGVDRTLRVLSVCEQILDVDVHGDVVIVSPVIGEVDARMVTEASRHALTVVDVQGFVRINVRGLVALRRPTGDVISYLLKATVVRGSVSEILTLTGSRNINEGLKRLIRKGVEVAVATSSRGALVVTREGVYAVPAYRWRRVVCPTGAGDVFTALFAYAYATRGDPIKAAALGMAGASMIIEGVGPRVLDRLELEERSRLVIEEAE